MLLGSDTCSGTSCHTDLVNQWRGSPHRFSVNNLFFKKQIALFIEMEGPEYVRICINCHDPVAALLPDAEERYARGEIDNPEGISCKACHVITAFDETRGNGLYFIKAPFSYPFDGSPEGSEERSIHDSAIHSDQRRHLRSYRRKQLYRKSNYCITCHLVTVPEQITGGKALRLHTLFDQWSGSKWEEITNCVDCHLPRFQMDLNGYSFFDHRIMGINTDLLLTAEVPLGDVPYVKDYNYFVGRYLAGDLSKGAYEVVADPSTYKFRKNPKREINIFQLFYPSEITRFLSSSIFLASGPILNLEVTGLNTATPENRLEVHTRTTNIRVGHNFPSGPIDVQEIWLEGILKEGSNSTIAHVGGMDENHYVDPSAPILGSRGIIDSEGQPLLRHEFWKAAAVIDKRVLVPFGSTEDRLLLPLPDPPIGEYNLIIRWNFRRMNQRIVDWVWEGENVSMPVIVLDYSNVKFAIETDPVDENRYVVKIRDVSRPYRDREMNWLDVLRGQRVE